ncbi:MAG: type II toxin-antitoxin system RelE/ParE family toxin [Bdellovibrionales bacterium]|nr:type II toxin-antitoxin system RelE/ParE family toxin [Bdellovibrionales bacterium]
MDVKARRIVLLRLENGSSLFEEWMKGIRSSKHKRVIDARLIRVRNGNFGDHKYLGEGVYELRIFVGPGFRVYYGLDGDTIIVLLGGGSKHTQNKDIKTAKDIWRKYGDEN